MSYAKVYEEYWDGEKIQPLSDRAALLGLYILTGPHRNAIGCFRLGKGAISDVPRFGGWGIEGVSKALLELEETGFIVRDEATNWMLIVNYLAKDPLSNVKIATHAAMLASKVPQNTEVYQRLYDILAPQLEAHSKGLTHKPGYPLDTPSIGHGIPHRTPDPDPDPDPDPEPEPEPTLGATPPVALAPRRRGNGAKPPSAIAGIFDCWCDTLGHPRARLDDKRRKVINRALKLGYTAAELCDAIRGCSLTPHNMGINDRGTRYDELGLILRDADHIDRFIRNAKDPPQPRNGAEARFLHNVANAESAMRLLDERDQREQTDDRH